MYTITMPSQILHTLFGEDVITGLSSRIKNSRIAGFLSDRAIKKADASYHDAFTLGCQGPDIFYHNRHTRPIGLEYGTLLHRRGYGIFSAALLKMGLPLRNENRKNRRKRGMNALGIYALGFMTHALLDRACHPYIIYKSEGLKITNPNEHGIYHPFFERIIDVLMLKRLRRQKASSWNQEMLAKACTNPPRGLKKLIARALTAAFPERVKQDGKLKQRIDNAFTDSGYFYHYSDPVKTSINIRTIQDEELPVSRRFLSIVFPEDLPSDIDFLNLSKEPWYYPYQRPDQTRIPDTRSFPDIYTDAVETAINTLEPSMTQYLCSGIFPTADAVHTIGNSCLSIQDEEGKPCAPNCTAPLPLDEVLEEQVRIRGPIPTLTYRNLPEG